MALGNKRTPRKLIKGRTDGLLDSDKETRASASMAGDIFSQDAAYVDGNLTPIMYHADLIQEDIDELRRHIADDRTQTDNNFTTTLKNKLDGIEASADVTDFTNVSSAIVGNAPDLGTPASSDRVLILDNGSGNRLSYADFSEFGGSSSSPVLITSLTGRLEVKTSTDNAAQHVGLAGSLGANYYNWSQEYFTGAYGVSSGLGTPGTSTFSRGTGYKVVEGCFRALAAGTAGVAGTIEFDSNSEVAGQTLRIHVFKLDSTTLSSFDNGTYNSGWGGTLVASTSITIPSRNQSLAPMRFKSTNGTSVSADDMVFATAIYDGTVTSTRRFVINYQLYTT